MELIVEGYVPMHINMILIHVEHFSAQENHLILFLSLNSFFPNFFEEEPVVVPVRGLNEAHAINRKGQKLMFRGTKELFKELL
jgi:hypothetical protein